MERDIPDILDRFIISELKWERVGNEEQIREYNTFKKAFEKVKEKYNSIPWCYIEKMMEVIHSSIWFLETSLKGGKERLPNPHYLRDPINKEILAEIGMDSILIRNINSLRVNLKNLVSDLTNTGFKEIKSHHLSE